VVNWTKCVNIRARELYVLSLLLLPPLALGAYVELGQQFRLYSAETYFVYAAMVFVGSAGGMLFRLKNAYMATGAVKYPLLFISSDMVGGWGAGLACGAAAFEYGLSAGWIIGVGIVSSFGGSLLLDKAWQLISDKILRIAPHTKMGKMIAEVKGQESAQSKTEGDGDEEPRPPRRAPR
jgi:hypothetical protein